MRTPGLCVCTSLGVLSCSSVERPTSPTLADCVSANCRPATASGAGSSRDAAPPSEAQRDGEVPAPLRITVQVEQTSDTTFVGSTPFRGAVEVHAHGDDGRFITSGATPLQAPFALDLSAGTTWFAVIDRASIPLLAPTLQGDMLDVSAPSAALRGVAWDGLTNLFIDNVQWVPRTGAATLILSFRRRGASVPGVTVSPVAGAGSSTAYFESENRYATDGPTSAFASTVIVPDIARLPAYPTLTTIAVQYQVGASAALLPVRAAANFVTWVPVEVP